jgi:hypothetical protein
MTTYATSTPEQAPYTDGPTTPPPRNASGPPTQRAARRRRRAGVLVSAGALALAAAAATVTAMALITPPHPAQRTVNVVPSPPTAYSSSEIQAAKDTACSAWDRAARITAQASKASASALGTNRDYQAPTSSGALLDEKRTRVAAVSYLRTQLSPATPNEVVEPIQQWIAASLDELHALVQRSWDAAEVALQRGNSLIDPVTSACGLR